MPELVKPPRRKPRRRADALIAEEDEETEPETEAPDFSVLGIEEPPLPGGPGVDTEEAGAGAEEEKPEAGG